MYFVHLSDKKWQQYKDDKTTIFCFGYLINSSFESLFEDLFKVTRDQKISRKNIENVLKRYNGHFSVIIKSDSFIYFQVDHARTIPLFYISGSKVYVSDQPSLIERYLPNKALDNQSILEIATAGYTIGKNTIYNSLKQLRAGENYFCSKESGCSSSFYVKWKPRKYTNGYSTNKLSELVLSSIDDLISNTKGRQIVVPLSAGFDSRAIVSGLKHLGAKNVICIYYGRKNSFEQIASQRISETLGYKWIDIELSDKYQKDFFSSEIYSEYVSKYDTYASIPFVQDVSAFNIIHDKNYIDADAVIVNGNTGYFNGGDQQIERISKNCKTIEEHLLKYYLSKNHSLWKNLRSLENDKKIINSLLLEIKEQGVEEEIIKNHHLLIYELAEHICRQTKYMTTAQRAYEYFNYDWMLPLWDARFVDFWDSASPEQKYNKKIYKDMLLEKNWGNVWNNIPVNQKYISPFLLKQTRNLFKYTLATILGKKAWHTIDNNIFQYWMDDSRNSVSEPYRNYLFDTFGHRSRISWQSLRYLDQKNQRLKDYA